MVFGIEKKNHHFFTLISPKPVPKPSDGPKNTPRTTKKKMVKNRCFDNFFIKTSIRLHFDHPGPVFDHLD